MYGIVDITVAPPLPLMGVQLHFSASMPPSSLVFSLPLTLFAGKGATHIFLTLNDLTRFVSVMCAGLNER